MLSVRRSTSARTFVVPFTLVCFLAACYKYTPVEEPYSAAFEERQPDRLRFTVANDSTFVMNDPRIEGETLVGYTDPCRALPSARGSCESSFAIAEIEQCEDRQKDGLATG